MHSHTLILKRQTSPPVPLKTTSMFTDLEGNGGRPLFWICESEGCQHILKDKLQEGKIFAYFVHSCIPSAEKCLWIYYLIESSTLVGGHLPDLVLQSRKLGFKELSYTVTQLVSGELWLSGLSHSSPPA